MPLRQHKAKAHVFLDVAMEQVTKPTPEHEVKAGAGTKVVATIGPSCQDVPTMVKMLEAGVTCARVDLSWGTKQYHARSLTNLGEAMKQTRRLCSVWLDTFGREVVVRRPVEHEPSGWPRQTGEKKVAVEAGQTITITTDSKVEPSATVFPVNYPGFTDIVSEGQQLQISRYLATGAEGGSLYLRVEEVGGGNVRCVAQNSALLDGLLTVMICHTDNEDFRGDFGLPLLTEHDVDCIRTLGSQFEVDFISLSYCNSEDDVLAARGVLDSLGMASTKIIAKVERKSAVRNFEGIAAAADGIIISRGNLGLDFEPEVMALLQKRIISRCNQLGKPVLITRIVDTMVTTPRPTRAEATDVANAVLDGVDGMLLGAETLRGEHPVLTVETVLRLTAAAEKYFDYRTHHEMLMGEAYEEEVSLEHASHASVSDFGMLGHATRSPNQSTHEAQRHRLQSNGSSQRLHSSFGSSQGLYAFGSSHGLAAVATAAAAKPNRQGSNGSSDDSSAAAANGVDQSDLLHQFAEVGSPGQPYHAALMSEFGSLPPKHANSSEQLNRILQTHAPYMSKLESLASSATRTAEKIAAGLIIVMVQSGRTVSLVAKYRPPMPIMAVVVPKLKSTALGWQLEGKYLARQTLVLRGVVPMLAAPMSEGSEDLISEAIASAFQQGLVAPSQYVVCLKSVRGSMMVKVVQVNEAGTGMKLTSGVNTGNGATGVPSDAIAGMGGLLVSTPSEAIC